METLIVFENLEVTRYVLKDSAGAQHILNLTKQQETAGREQFMDKETGQEMEIVSQESFLEWIAEHYKARSPPSSIQSQDGSCNSYFLAANVT